MKFHMPVPARVAVFTSASSELIDLALQERVESGLGKARRQRPSLSQSASLNKLFRSDHDLRAQRRLRACSSGKSQVRTHFRFHGPS